MPSLESLQELIGGPRDGPLLRFALANELLKAGQAQEAVSHLRDAVKADPEFSAAWKLLGRALTAAGRAADALAAYRQGIAVAEARGDVQAAREMKVFARRLEKALAP